MTNVQFWARYPSGVGFYRSKDIKRMIIDFLREQDDDYFAEQIRNLNIWKIEEFNRVNDRIFEARRGKKISLVVFDLDNNIVSKVATASNMGDYDISIFRAVSTKQAEEIDGVEYPILSFLYLDEEELETIEELY